MRPSRSAPAPRRPAPLSADALDRVLLIRFATDMDSPSPKSNSSSAASAITLASALGGKNSLPASSPKSNKTSPAPSNSKPFSRASSAVHCPSLQFCVQRLSLSEKPPLPQEHTALGLVLLSAHGSRTTRALKTAPLAFAREFPYPLPTLFDIFPRRGFSAASGM